MAAAFRRRVAIASLEYRLSPRNGKAYRLCCSLTGPLPLPSLQVEVSGNTITISASNVSFAKRYFKFLAKRYLKKNSLREYMRVLATSKTGYSLKYYSIGEEEETE